ncbi:hypothetical protein UlMin_013630 [Ulmus minor]
MAEIAGEGDLHFILSEQRKELMAAQTLESDLDLAFQLQMEEAMKTSLALKPSSSNSPPPPQPESAVLIGCEDVVSGLAPTLLMQDVDRYMQELEDHKCCEVEARKVREDLDRRIHDQKVASEILSLPEDYWREYGDQFEKPYGSGGSSSSAGSAVEGLRLYFKGLVSEERVRDVKVVVAGAGIAICDPKNNLLFQSRKNLEAIVGGEVLCGEAAELEALVEGLNKALFLDLKRVTFVCENYTLYQYVTNSLAPRNSKIATLVNQVGLLERKFTYCSPSFVAQNNVKYAFKLAREAVVSQITWPAESSKGKNLKETCVICFEDADVAQMFSIDGCLHRYCFSCMKLHVEAELNNGRLAKCPYEGCNSEVAIESCAKFLPPNLVEVMSQRMKESAVPVTQKIYCPDPRCSALMSKTEVLEYTKIYFLGAENSGARKCINCQKFFCINCKVPWHYDMTCYDHKRAYPHPRGEDQMLKSLATRKLWRQCAKCNHMVELADGCYHITCRCGYEFCYTCGAEWKHKRPTCKCPIWDERNIIRDERRQPQQRRR